MTPQDIAALREAAEAAKRLTPHEWEAGDSWVYTYPIEEDDGNALANIMGRKYAVPERAERERDRVQANCEHVAAFQPDAVLALLSEVERGRALRAAVEALAGEWADCGCAVCWHRAASRELRAALSGHDADAAIAALSAHLAVPVPGGVAARKQEAGE